MPLEYFDVIARGESLMSRTPGLVSFKARSPRASLLSYLPNFWYVTSRAVKEGSDCAVEYIRITWLARHNKVEKCMYAIFRGWASWMCCFNVLERKWRRCRRDGRWRSMSSMKGLKTKLDMPGERRGRRCLASHSERMVKTYYFRCWMTGARAHTTTDTQHIRARTSTMLWRQQEHKK